MPERPVRSLLGRRRLGPVLVAAGPDATARDAAQRMAETCRGNLLVVEDGRALGLFTERDLLDRVVAAGRDPARTRLREVMTTEPATVEADAPVREAILRMDAGGLRHLVVVEGERVLGVLSNRDIPVLELGHVAERLREQSRPAGRLENGSSAYA
jgi:CBS domain-containing protein